MSYAMRQLWIIAFSLLVIAAATIAPTTAAGPIDDVKRQVWAIRDCALDPNRDGFPPELSIEEMGAVPECILSDEGSFCYSETRHTGTPDTPQDDYTTSGCVYHTQSGEIFWTCYVHSHYNDPNQDSYTEMVPEGCSA